MKNIESIRLYRDILRASKHFVWNNDKGIPWSKILKENARKEFEQARYENDPLIVARMLVVGRDCLMQTIDKYINVTKEFKDNIDKTKQK